MNKNVLSVKYSIIAKNKDRQFNHCDITGAH